MQLIQSRIQNNLEGKPNTYNPSQPSKRSVKSNNNSISTKPYEVPQQQVDLMLSTVK